MPTRNVVMVDDLGLVTGPTAYAAYTTLNQVIAAVGADDITVVVNRQLTADNDTVPANLTLLFMRNGEVSVNVGQTVTGNGPVIADDHQIFTGLGTFTLNTYPQNQAWWGNPDDFSIGDGAGAGFDVAAHLWTVGKNAIINGNFDFWQRGTSFNQLAHDTYGADRFCAWIDNTAAGKIDHDQDTNTPTQAQSGYYSDYSLKLTVDTPDGAVGAAEWYGFSHRVEGYNINPMIDREVTLSFWVRSSVTGTYCVSFRPSGYDACYIAEYVINVADTWEKKTVTFTIDDTLGTWNYQNGIGLDITWSLGSGSNFNNTADTWQATDDVQTANQEMWIMNAGATFYISQVQLELGGKATLFARTGGVISNELECCQRYYYIIIGGGVGSRVVDAVHNATGVETFSASLNHPTTMRTAPAVTKNGVWAAANCAQPTVPEVTDTSFAVKAVSAGAGFASFNTNSADDTLEFEAEL